MNMTRTEEDVWSWGRTKATRSLCFTPSHRGKALPDSAPSASWANESLLPHGLGRSYGDSCLNDGGGLIKTNRLDHMIRFDRDQGIVRCEAGVTFKSLLETCLPSGWFPPVTPGTKFVTIGGAIANDVHGKNHHRDGCFGHHLECFELLRSDGRYLCSKTSHPDLFHATIGGLGLTGLITWAEFRMKAAPSSFINQEVIRFQSLDEFFNLSEKSHQSHAYTVSWIDCLGRGRRLGRGLFIRGNHAKSSSMPRREPRGLKLAVPVDAPQFLLNPATLTLFNELYYRKPVRQTSTMVHYEPFFYPLDKILQWNRIYGKRGFYQYQCVVPYDDGGSTIAAILGVISQARMGSFLAVLKTFGNHEPAGLMSFPREGVTLALDFPNLGTKVLDLMDRLDEMVVAAGGRVYPAKDARMGSASFHAYYPEFQRFREFIDPMFSSDFLKRVR